MEPAHLAIDFDNTLVDYRAVFVEVATCLGWVEPNCGLNKTALRDYLRTQEGGEQKWQQLQAKVYGSEILRAVPFDGAFETLDQLRQAGWTLSIVSHKTQFAAADPNGCDLREAALSWLEYYHFLPNIVPPSRVHFADSRLIKCQTLQVIGASYMIDDLPEFLEDPAFPEDVVKIHFISDPCEPVAGAMAVRHWPDLFLMLKRN